VKTNSDRRNITPNIREKLQTETKHNHEDKVIHDVNSWKNKLQRGLKDQNDDGYRKEGNWRC
jgi:hypothetical protein